MASSIGMILRKFIAGSEKLGEYPRTQWSDWEAVRNQCQTTANAFGLAVQQTGDNTAGVPTKVQGHYSDVIAQVGDRWKCADGRFRSLSEQVMQIRNFAEAFKQLPADSGQGAPVVVPPKQPSANLPKPDWMSGLKTGADVRKCGYKDTKWNTENGGSWPPPIEDVDGKPAIRFRLPGNGKRIEVEPDHRTFPGQGTWFFGFEFKLGDDYPLSANTWQVIWQLHGNDTTSPLFALQARNGQLRVGDNQRVADIGKARWYSVVVRADFSGGNMQVWLDGKDLGTKRVGRSNPNYYLKVGFYHDRSAPGGTIWQRNHTLGDSYDKANPAR